MEHYVHVRSAVSKKKPLPSSPVLRQLYIIIKPIVDKVIADKVTPHIDQVDESDMAFLDRLGRRYDTVATVKVGRLLFLRILDAKTLLEQSIPQMDICRSQGDSHTYLEASRDAYTGVVAHWRDPRKATKKKVVVGVIGNAKHMRETYANEQDALVAATSERERSRRGQASMRFSMATGTPQLTPQYRIDFADFKDPMGDRTWLIKTIIHRLGEQGLSTDLPFELYKLSNLIAASKKL